MQDMPYFMNDKKWYGFDYNKKQYFCTDIAPQKAKESLTEFYKEEARTISNLK